MSVLWALVLVACLMFCSMAATAADPLEVGNLHQLFIDDHVIAARTDVDLTLHEPTKYSGSPVLRPERPWEKGVALYGTVMYDEQEGLFKAWYRGMEDTCYVCYATSEDGIRWDKPVLNVKTYKGSTENNIVLGSRTPLFYIDGFGVIKDLDDPDPARRYKLLTYNNKRRFAAMVSPDGIRWEGPINPKAHDTGDVISVYYDTGLDQFVGLLKRRFVYEDGSRKRARLVSYSDDFVTWSDPQWALVPDEKDPPTTEFYSHVAFMYEGMRIGYVTKFETATEKIDTQLCFSRDGKKWERYRERVPFLPNGPDGSFDAGMLIAGGSGLVIRDRTLWIYYCGFNIDHAGRTYGDAADLVGIGLAHLRIDGFVSADAGPEGGTLLTVPLRCSAKTLRVNVDASGGEVRAELLDARGRPIPGYDAASALPFTGDSIDAPLVWQGHTGIAAVGETVQVRFHLKNASLYSFWFAEE